MKKLLLAATLLLCGASAFCQGLQWGPWVTETRENSLSILWVSEQPGTMGNDFPIMVNDEARRLDVEADAQKITLRTWNAKGEMEFSKTIGL